MHPWPQVLFHHIHALEAILENTKDQILEIHTQCVVELGKFIFSSSAVLSKVMEGGDSPGLRKWLMVSNCTKQK
jgi:hypothetical protein